MNGMPRNGEFIYDERVKRLAASARAASSPEELSRICVAMNIADVINLGRMDMWIAKYALTAVYCTLRKFPKIRPYLHYFGILTYFEQNRARIYEPHAGGRADLVADLVQSTEAFCRDSHICFANGGLGLAFYMGVRGYEFSGIIVNGRTFAHADILNTLQQYERVGYYPKGCNTVKSVIDHELGHMLDYALSICESREFRRFLQKYDADTLSRELSAYCAYGGVKEREVIAEAYSECCNSTSPRPIALEVMGIIERAYHARYG